MTALPTDPAGDARRETRRAALVAAIAGLAFPVWVFTTMVVAEGFRGDMPEVDEPGRQLVPWIADNFTRIRVVATMRMVMWIVLLVFVVALVQYTRRRVGLLGLLTVALTAAGTAVGVAGQAVFASPTMVWELNERNLAANLDPGVARWMLISGDVSGTFAAMLFGAALATLGIRFLCSDVMARRFLGITAIVIGAGALLGPVLGNGNDNPLPAFLALWAIVAAILLLVARRRAAAE